MKKLKDMLLTRQEIVDVVACLYHDWGQDTLMHMRPSSVRRQENTWLQLNRMYKKRRGVIQDFDVTYDTLSPRQQWYYHYLEVKWGLVLVKRPEHYTFTALTEAQGKNNNFFVGVEKSKIPSPVWIQSLRHQGVVNTHPNYHTLLHNCSYDEAHKYTTALALECAHFYKGQASGVYNYQAHIVNDTILDEKVFDVWHTDGQHEDRQILEKVPYPTVEMFLNALKRERRDWQQYQPYYTEPLNELYLFKAHEKFLKLTPGQGDTVLTQAMVDDILNNTRRSDAENQMDVWILDLLVAGGWWSLREVEDHKEIVLWRYLLDYKSNVRFIEIKQAMEEDYAENKKEDN